MSLEMAHKVILPPKKNYIPQFLKQRDINSYYPTSPSLNQSVVKNKIVFVSRMIGCSCEDDYKELVWFELKKVRYFDYNRPPISLYITSSLRQLTLNLYNHFS
jgi:hypothetical protein